MSIRTDKVASLIKTEMSAILLREITLDTNAFMTVTDVIMTADLRIAKVYLSVYASSEVKEAVIKELTRRKGEVRYILGSRIRLRYTPELQFYLDTTLERMDSMERIFKKIRGNERE